MECWKADLNRGIHYLSKHDPGSAVMYFSRAMANCPVTNSRELARLLFYLGMAFQRLGLFNSAIRSWIFALRVKKQKRTKKLLERFSNHYGMAKQNTMEMDDWQAFYSIQLMRYLRGFNKRTVTDQAERDCLREIIHAHWTALVGSGALRGRTAEEKSGIFRSTQIDFPLFFLGKIKDPVIRVNFQNGTKLKPGDRCLCGSGLPYFSCCGRTPGEDELLVGLF